MPREIKHADNKEELIRIIYDEFAGRIESVQPEKVDDLFFELAKKYEVDICRQIGLEELKEIEASGSIKNHSINGKVEPVKDYFLVYRVSGKKELANNKEGIFLVYYKKEVKTIKNNVDLINDLDH